MHKNLYISGYVIGAASATVCGQAQAPIGWGDHHLVQKSKGGDRFTRTDIELNSEAMNRESDSEHKRRVIYK